MICKAIANNYAKQVKERDIPCTKKGRPKRRNREDRKNANRGFVEEEAIHRQTITLANPLALTAPNESCAGGKSGRESKITDKSDKTTFQKELNSFFSSFSTTKVGTIFGHDFGNGLAMASSDDSPNHHNYLKLEYGRDRHDLD